MDASWGRFVASCSEAQNPKPIRTEYEYPLAGGLFDSVNKDISDLIENAAYLLSFNERIKRLHIDRGGQPLVIEKKNHERLTDSAQRVRIEEGVGDAAPTSRYVAVMVRENLSVAVELSNSDRDARQLGGGASGGRRRFWRKPHDRGRVRVDSKE